VVLRVHDRQPGQHGEAVLARRRADAGRVEAVDGREEHPHAQAGGELTGLVAPVAALGPVHVDLLQADHIGAQRPQGLGGARQVEPPVGTDPRVHVVRGNPQRHRPGVGRRLAVCRRGQRGAGRRGQQHAGRREE
jgi:hypothetical protein